MWEQIRHNYEVFRDYTYLMNASVGPLHQRIHHINVSWSLKLAQMGAIADPELYKLFDDVLFEASAFIGATKNQVAITPNTSSAINYLALSIQRSHKFKNEIITSLDEFPSSTIPWKHLGFELKLVPSVQGKVIIEDIKKQVSPKTAAVVISGVQFLTGFRINLKKLVQEVYPVPVICNGTQLMGQFPVDVKNSGISAFISSTHKWMGAGFCGSLLYLSDEFKKTLNWPPLMGWLSVDHFEEMKVDNSIFRQQVNSIEMGTTSPLAPACLIEAFRIQNELGRENIAQRILYLTSFLETLLKNKNVEIISFRDDQENQSGILTFKIPDAQLKVEQLKKDNVYVNLRRGMIRVSPHFYNSEKDLEKLVSLL